MLQGGSEFDSGTAAFERDCWLSKKNNVTRTVTNRIGLWERIVYPLSFSELAKSTRIAKCEILFNYFAVLPIRNLAIVLIKSATVCDVCKFLYFRAHLPRLLDP